MTDVDRTGDTPSEEQHTNHDARRASWRDWVKVHPAAELFPTMSDSGLDDLGADIKANGLMHPVVFCGSGNNEMLLDGRNRLEAIERKNLDPDSNWYMRAVRIGPDVDPYEYVVSANIHRRHLTDEQRREVIAKLIKAKPEESDRAIAKQTKVDHKTVGKVREKMESTVEVSPVEKRTGADGKKRKKPTKKAETDRERRDRKECVALFEKACAADPEFAEWLSGPKQQRAAGSAELSIEERRAQNAALDEPAEVDEVDKRVNCVTNTILRHVEGLSRGDAERFIAALRDRLADIAIEAIALRDSNGGES